MTIFESNAGLECPLQPMGNGKMLVYHSGISIWSVHCGYTSPSILSLFPDFGGGYYESESQRMSHHSSRQHRIWYTMEGVMNHCPGDNSQECDLLMNDYMAHEEGVGLRVLEGKLPLNWKISLPGYVRDAVVKNYHLINNEAHALFYTVSPGNEAECDSWLKKEINLTLFLFGDLNCSDNGRQICFEGGKGYFLFIDSSNESSSLKIAEKLILQLKKGVPPGEIPLFKSSEAYWSAELDQANKLGWSAACRISSQISGLRADRLSARLEDAAAALLSMQSDEGFFLTDGWHPYATATDLPLITAALIKLRCFDAAWKMLECWSNVLGSSIDKGAVIPSMLGSHMQCITLGDGSDAGASASYLLAVLLLIEADGKRLSSERMNYYYRKMRKAFVLTMSGFYDGMLPFLGGEACFENNSISRECYYHGSAIATAIAITAAERYFDFCERSGNKPARESERYKAILQTAREHFNFHFASKELYSITAVQIIEKTRRPRFIRSYCPICSTEVAFQATDRLELDRLGHYRCRRCFNIPIAQYELHRSSCFPSIDATAFVAMWMSEPFSQQAITQAQAYYRSIVNGQGTLPRRLGTADAMLLAASKRYDADRMLFTDILLKSASLTEDPRLELGALPSAFANGYEMQGAMCSSSAIAALILALYE